MSEFNKTIIFTDGACSGNPGPGGWGAVIATPEGKVWELGDGDPSTTNNQMEMIGCIEALKSLAKIEGKVILYTDSVYVIRGITQWVWGWRNRGWKTADGKDVANKELWEELSRVVGKRGKENSIEWKYVRGHKGVPGNERCDEIAVGFSKGERVSLYRGSLLKYPVAVMDLPEDEPLPEMKSKEPKAPAFSYLSLIGTIPMRHSSWAECERRVKGQSGAKFKKAMSAADEDEILRAWGYTRAHLKGT